MFQFVGDGQPSQERSRAASGRPGSPGAAALQVLRERRYPSLARRRSAFRALVRTLRLCESNDLGRVVDAVAEWASR